MITLQQMSAMVGRWPPSPSVEDEEVSLAKEHHAVSTTTKGDDNQQAVNVGAVNQTPVLLHKDDPEPTNSDAENEAPRRTANRSPQESTKSRVPPLAVPEQIYHGRENSFVPDQLDIPPLTRVMSARELNHDERLKARPHISRIKTDIRDDQYHHLTAQSQLPSAAAARGAPVHQYVQPPDSRKGDLSSPSQPSLSPTYRRAESFAESARRKQYRDDRYLSSAGTEYRRNEHRSKSRSARPSISEEEHPRRPDSGYQSAHSPTSKRPIIHQAVAPSEKRRSQHSYSQPASPSHSRKSSTNDERPSVTESLRMTGAHDAYKSASHKTPRESPNTSAGEDSAKERSHRSYKYSANDSRSRRASNVRGEKRYHTSSNVIHTTSVHAGQEERPRRQDSYVSVHAPSTRICPSPMSMHATQSMEDYFEKAFRDNQNKSRSGRSRPTTPSPALSAPITPPRTLHLDRDKRDVLQSAVPNSKLSGVRPRPTSSSDDRSSDPHSTSSLLSAAIGGAAASIVNKTWPMFTRSSTTSSDTTTSLQNKPGSAQRSGRPSPDHEEPKPVSRQNSTSVQPGRPQMLTPDATDTRAIYRTTSYVPQPTRATVVPPRSISYTTTHDHNLSRSPSISQKSTTSSKPPTASGYSTSATSPLILPSRSTQNPSRPPSFSAYVSLPSSQDFALPPCPHSVPRLGYHDWYTIKGMTHLDICPSCMGVLGNSRYRDLFLPSMSKPPGQAVCCAMSKPWPRIAFEQSVKQHRTDLSLLLLLSTTPHNTYPCPGKKSEIRKWFELEDPRTKSAVPNFDVCSDCVCRVETTFPQLRGMFWRPDKKLSTEKLCNLRIHSKHFTSIMTELEKLAQRVGNDKWRHEDVKPFVKHVLKVSRYRECARDGMLATSAWHFMPDLPELTICEECYDEFVWPLHEKPLANEISRSTRVVPGTRNGQREMGTSCQLYSERMRRIFVEAVERNDFRLLKEAAVGRFRAERYLQEHQKNLIALERNGYNVRTEMEKSLELWKSYE